MVVWCCCDSVSVGLEIGVGFGHCHLVIVDVFTSLYLFTKIAGTELHRFYVSAVLLSFFLSFFQSICCLNCQ